MIPNYPNLRDSRSIFPKAANHQILQNAKMNSYANWNFAKFPLCIENQHRSSMRFLASFLSADSIADMNYEY